MTNDGQGDGNDGQGDGGLAASNGQEDSALSVNDGQEEERRKRIGGGRVRYPRSSHGNASHGSQTQDPWRMIDLQWGVIGFRDFDGDCLEHLGDGKSQRVLECTRIQP